ncbi:Polyketide synthase 19 [Dissostichus eleginoides]|uniref:Polyketide synthase 19 n=1 Tax=Dissostichus eleginoides TaxID=100907 RepID=A0AAD9CL99_DISEL|nr:Polyketide synthase 19 [Dissostichus eleginoides]
MLTRCRAIRLIEGCPRLNIRGISLPLSGLMGRINNAAHSCQDACGIPMFPPAAPTSDGAPALLGGC